MYGYWSTITNSAIPEPEAVPVENVVDGVTETEDPDPDCVTVSVGQ